MDGSKLIYSKKCLIEGCFNVFLRFDPIGAKKDKSC